MNSCKESKIVCTHHMEYGPIRRIILVRNVSKYMAKKYGYKKAEEINLKKALNNK